MELQWAFFQPLLGGALIGLAASVLLFFNGRIAGISGIIGTALLKVKGDFFWRIAFIFGLVAGGWLLFEIRPEFFVNIDKRGMIEVSIAGLLVGIGTMTAAGCTSGHGVCGISRWSMRSLLATVAFILAGIASVAVWRFL